MYQGVTRQTVTILNGATASSVIEAGATSRIGAILFPAAFTGATIKLYGSDRRDGTYSEIVDNTGAAITITPATSKWVTLSSAMQDQFAPFEFLKIVSASAEGADRTLVVVAKGY